MMKSRLIYLLTYAGMWLLALLPFRALYVLSDGLCFLMRHVVHYRRRVVENFIKAGAFDGLGGSRRQFMMVYAAILDQVLQEKKHSLEGQMSLFDLVSEEENVALTDWVYDWIHQDQIDWYNWAIDGLQSIKPDVQTSMFFHIPIKQFADMYYADQLQKGNDVPSEIDVSLLAPVRDVKGTVCESDKDESELIDPGYTVGIFYQGKNPEAATHPDIFPSVKAQNSTKGIFCGHDHANTLKGYYDGIYLGYGLCCGYHTYPFFDSEWFLTKWLGLSDKVLYNGDLWVDEAGNKMQKGVTMIQVALEGDYGALTVTDIQSDKL